MTIDQDIYRTVLDNLENGVCLVDRQGAVVFWNEGAEAITGYLRQEAIGRSIESLLMECDETSRMLYGTASPLTGAMHDGKRRTSDLLILHKDGQRVPVRVRCGPVRDAAGAIVGARQSFDELVLAPGAQHNPRVFRDSTDKLTGVLDGASLDAHLAAAVREYQENRVPLAVLAMSIDQLDDFRKRHGIVAAQATLRVAAQTLARNVGPLDVVARRHGEDYFFAVLTGCPAAYLAAVALKFQRIASRASVRWWGDDLSITISIGGTAAEAGDSAEALLERSRNALARSHADDRHVVII